VSAFEAVLAVLVIFNRLSYLLLSVHHKRPSLCRFLVDRLACQKKELAYTLTRLSCYLDFLSFCVVLNEKGARVLLHKLSIVVKRNLPFEVVYQNVPSSRNLMLVRFPVFESKVNEIGRRPNSQRAFNAQNFSSHNFGLQVPII